MKTITGYLIAAVLMAIVGAACLATGLLERAIAHAQEHVVSADYGEPQQIFQSVERYYEYASRLPWIGNGPVNDIRAREAALEYWQGHYVAVVPELADPVANIPPDNLDLQFLVASAMYREGLTQAKDKQTTIAALDAAANAYLTVLRNATRHDDASYNYEYVVKLRNDVDKGRKAPRPLPPAPGGNRGSRPDEADEAKFKVWVPLETSEIPAKAGKDDAPIKKKG